MKAHTWNGASYIIAYSALNFLVAAAVVSGYLEEPKWKPADNCELDGLHYLCRSGKCIPKEWLCDGTFDCPNNDDELHETCNPKGNLERGNCPARQFECVSPSGEKRCAREEWRCDGNRDCANGIDEEGCETTTTPVTRGVTATTTMKRNVTEAKRTPEPLMAVDEKNSTTSCDDTGKFRCADGQCIAASSMCNGISDCADGSDELTGKCTPAPAPPAPVVQSAAVNNPFADAERLFGPKTTTTTSTTTTTRTTRTSSLSSSASTKMAGTVSSNGTTTGTTSASNRTTSIPSRSSATTSNPITATTTTTVRPKPMPQRKEPEDEEEQTEPLRSEGSNGTAAAGATLSKSSEAKPVEAAIGTPIVSKDDEYATGSDGQTSFTRKTPTVYPAFQYAGDHREFLKSHPPPHRGP